MPSFAMKLGNSLMNQGEQRLIPEELDVLKTSKTRLTYFKGETIFKQGAFAPYVIYIVEGLARITLETGAGKQMNIRLAGKGDFMALSAIFGENRYQTTAIALKDTLTCMIDKESLGELLKVNPDLSIRINTQTFDDETRLLALVKSLSYNQMRGKLAGALLYLAQEKFIQEDIFELLTRQDISQFAGISLESTVKFLKEFSQEGLIVLDGRQISIADREGMLNLTLHA